MCEFGEGVILEIMFYVNSGTTAFFVSSRTNNFFPVLTFYSVYSLFIQELGGNCLLYEVQFKTVLPTFVEA